MQILMIRHGRTEWNEARRIQGRTDIPLNQRGRDEQACRTLPAGFADAVAWSSPLARATETARLLGAIDPSIDERLIEMDFGTWEGRTHTELTAEDPTGMRDLEAQGVDMRPPSGETPREVSTRLLEFLSGLGGGRQVLFSHKGVMRSAFAKALGWNMKEDLPFRVDWNAGQLFRFENGDLTLDKANLPLTAT
jgi:probable phosphoglycerate mutase